MTDKVAARYAPLVGKGKCARGRFRARGQPPVLRRHRTAAAARRAVAATAGCKGAPGLGVVRQAAMQGRPSREEWRARASAGCEESPASLARGMQGGAEQGGGGREG